MWFNSSIPKNAPTILMVALLPLAGCSGGSGGGQSNGGHGGNNDNNSATTPEFRTVSGTVAVGKPIANATITAKCEGGSGFRDPVTSAADGTFSGKIEEEAPPCALRAQGGTPSEELYSLVQNPIGTTNITPLTDLGIALASGMKPADWFAQSADSFANTGTELDSAVSSLLFALEDAGFQFPVDQPDDLTAPDTDLNPFTDPFSIGDSVDQAIDELQLAIDNDSNISSYAALINIVKDGNLAQIPSAPSDSGPIIVTDASRVSNPDDGDLTISEAVVEANQTSGQDVIRFHSSLAGQTIETSSIGISSPMTIEGPKPQRITLKGTQSNPLVTVLDDDVEKTVNVSAKIENLTLSNAGNVLAGCIHNHEMLRLVNVTVEQCEATTGAGVVNDGGILTVRDSIIADNKADVGKAGGLLNKTKYQPNLQQPDGSIKKYPTLRGTVTLVNTEVTGNRGSGIENGDLMTIRQSRVATNEKDGPGGGIWQAVGSNGGKLEVINSVIENNVAGRGAGIAGNGMITLVNSTVSGNKAELNQTPTVQGQLGGGGGIFADNEVRLYNTSVVNNSATHRVGGIWALHGAELLNSTIAGNEADTRGDYANDNLPGTPIANLKSPAIKTTVGNVILSDAIGGSNISLGAPAIGGIRGQNVIEGGLPSGPDPKVKKSNPALGPLRDNGGSVPVRVPGSGSVALDLGLPSAIPADVADLDKDGDEGEAIPFDARGQGFDRVVGGSVDAGAVERNAAGG